ncbi:MAG: hypothetical protein C5B59_12865 [Bacteroidetes bacterium]|nr:MAG: hypothetical protein C5B59_12865 [Bacteroidota bacterium]
MFDHLEGTIRQHNLFWGSSYDRGLDLVLPLWPMIREKFPDATLNICYGWELFDKGYANNAERKAWKERISKLMEQPGITHYGRIGKDQVKELEDRCGVWVYPTYFPEINCITALDCQKEGCVPCVVGIAALFETVQSGVIIEGDAYDKEVQHKWLNALLDLMGNEEKWKAEQEKGKKFVEGLTWPKVAEQWVLEFDDGPKE